MGVIVLRVVIGLVVLAVIGGIYGFIVTRTKGPLLTEAKVGDCLNLTDFDLSKQDSGKVSRYKPKSCTKAHTGEVIGNVASPLPKGADYPGEDALLDFAGERCGAAFEEYVGIAYDESELEVVQIYPTKGSWNGGDRGVICVATNPGGSALTESVKGIAR